MASFLFLSFILLKEEAISILLCLKDAVDKLNN
jgi:hypothetical protein